MSAEDKTSRGRKKALVTRAINNIDRFIAEENEGKLKENIERAVAAFEEFESIHYRYHDALENDDFVEESEAYFEAVQKDYVSKLNEAKGWLKARKSETAEEKSAILVQPQQDVLSILNLPKIELEVYDGDPLTYHSFMAMFDEVVHKSACENRVKLTRLLQYTKGKAKEAIRSCILLKGDDAYDHAREILNDRFGNDHLVTDRIVENLRRGKPVRSPQDLQQLADELLTCEKTLSQMGTLAEVDSQRCILEVVNRLESFIQFRWKRQALETKRSNKVYPKFKEFVQFIVKEADEATDPVYGCVGGRQKQSQKQPIKMTNSFSSSASMHVNSQQRPVRKCVLCLNDHKLLYCPEFKRMSVNGRTRVVNDHKLCSVCLLDNHRTAECKREYTCTVAGCGQRHSKFLHVIQNYDNANNVNLFVMTDQVSNGDINSDISLEHESMNTENMNATFSGVTNAHLPVVSVRINGSVVVNALLDTGSSNSFCTSKLASQLCLARDSVSCKLSTLHGSKEKPVDVVKRLKVASIDGSKTVDIINILVVHEIPVQTMCVNVSAFPHLVDIPLVAGNETVDLLIGQDCSEALIPLEVCRGNEFEPFAVRTLFGWSVNGPCRLVHDASTSALSNFENVSLEERVSNMWSIENENISSDEIAWSKCDKDVIDLWESSVVKVDGHYQLPIPWKSGVSIPNNLCMAISRLKSLHVSLKRKVLFDKYDAEMQKLLSEGYAERVPDSEIDRQDNVWYLPHHAVVSDSKPGKTRIVFDCAAKFKGESLNDKIHQGPDLCNKLLHVLLRFRQYKIAITSDVQAMYYQVLIPPNERDALRFLWFDNGSGKMCHFRMTRHVFGGVWCSASSTFALRKVLEDAFNINPLVADTILRSFYVDDCLRSVSCVADAQVVIQGTKSLLDEGGFRLTKFIVNDSSLWFDIPPEDRASESSDFEFMKESKVLGIKWCVNDDCFHFDVQIDSPGTVTRRSILSLVSSMYDPLGLVSPIILQGRLIFQEVTRLKLGWDECVPPHIEKQWREWVQGLSALGAIKFPRCVTSGDVSDMVFEIHNFCDASTNAYGFGSYLRSIDKQGVVHTCLLMAKSRVAPLNAVTIPRLELQAAVMAAQGNAMLRKQLDLEITRCYFWTDSEIVLKYIHNESQRFHIFVSNRLSQIRQLTCINEWCHIPGKQNPADVVSRGSSVKNLNQDEWIKGPQFIRSYKSDWHVPVLDITLPASDPEVKVTCHFIVADGEDSIVDRLCKYYSGWYKLKRAVAWLLRLKDLLRHRVKYSGHILSVKEVEVAELVIVKDVQQRHYGSELSCLTSGSPISKSSSLSELDPRLDQEGRLIIGGRLTNAANLSECCKHPCIIPYDHPVARLIILDEHNKAHLGVEWVVANVRKRFWITRIRRVAKSVSQKCIKCKRLFADPLSQKMADLIPERSEPGNPPFTHTGLDCFGPFMVKQGRSQVKRYGCIFTCINTRAVHIEVLHSMDTDSFINGLRRFVSRRGIPSVIWSDNGSNFIGSNAELKRALSHLDLNLIQNYGVQNNFEWRFNPPCAAHKGGLWERLIGTIKKVLAGLSDVNTRMTDEILSTLMCEVESIINGRPITKASEDVNDMSALTPNHLLLLRGCPNISPGKFGRVDLYKRRWRCVQHLAQQFWRRWLREYLPELQKRHKWRSPERNVKVGDLVLVIEENTPRGVWPLGLVQEVMGSADGHVRTVKVKTKSTTLTRPVTKLVLLEQADV